MSEGRNGVGDISFWVDDCLFPMFVLTYLDTTGEGIHGPQFGFVFFISWRTLEEKSEYVDM